MWKDAGDLIDEDPATASLLIGNTIQIALTGLHRQWPPKPEYLLRDLEKWNPVAGFARRALALDCPMLQIYQLLSSLIMRTLDLVGGCLAEWHTIPEMLADE